MSEEKSLYDVKLLVLRNMKSGSKLGPQDDSSKLGSKDSQKIDPLVSSYKIKQIKASSEEEAWTKADEQFDGKVTDVKLSNIQEALDSIEKANE